MKSGLTKSLLPLIILSLSFNVFADESKVSFSGDAFIRAYVKDNTSDHGTGAFTQFLRLKSSFKADEQVTVKMGAIYASSNMGGDFRLTSTPTTTALGSTTSTTIGEQTSGGGENIRLDFAHFEYFNGDIFVAMGRQAVTSPGAFLTSDDRRDRFAIAKFFGQNSLVAIYDKREEGTLANAKDDLDMYSLNFYGKTEKMNYALQSGYFAQEATSSTALLKLKSVKQFTPQLTYMFDALTLDAYYTIVGDGKGNAIYRDWHHSSALKTTSNFANFKLEVLGIYVIDGGLIATGFDTLSSVINNSPVNYRSSINLGNLGSGAGAKKADETMAMTKLSRDFSENFGASIGAGHVRYYSSGDLKNNTVVDASLRMQISKASFAKLNYGQLFGETDKLASNITYYVNF